MKYEPSPIPSGVVVLIAKDSRTATTTTTASGVEMRVVWSPHNGRPEPMTVTLGSNNGRPLSAGEIRQLPLGEMLTGSRRDLDELVSSPPRNLTQQARKFIERLGFDPDDYQQRVDSHWEFNRQRFADRGSQRGRSLTDDDLRVVADAYRRAWIEGSSVTQAVIDAFGGGLTLSGAGKRIMKARAAGLLEGVGPTR